MRKVQALQNKKWHFVDGAGVDFRYCGWEFKVDSWIDLDFDSTIHNSGYQVPTFERW